VRFFASFTTDDGASTYSCNVSATAIVGQNDKRIKITIFIALSVSKEGWDKQWIY